MSIRDKIKNNSTIKDASMLDESIFFNEKDMIPTFIPMINVALSGMLEGGMTPGLTMWAGPSKHFKTLFSLILAKAYLEKYKDSVMLFYDTEFGTPRHYFSSLGIKEEQVFHTPVTDLEQLKFDIVQQLDKIERGDKVIIVIDSIGNLASKKEVEDAMEGKSVADMSRAKQLKSLFRIITPHLNVKDIPMVVVNHTYKEIGLYPRDIVGGGTGSYYSSDNIFIVGRQQEKDGKDLQGYNYIINVEKSRYVKEKSKIPISVTFEGGINQFSGLFEAAEDYGYFKQAKKGFYTVEGGDKSYRRSELDRKEYLEPLLENESFKTYIRNKYQIGTNNMINHEEFEQAYEE